MSKEQLIEIIQELTRTKVHYYRTLRAEEVIIDTIVFDIYNDLMDYMEYEMNTYLPNITEFELLEMITGGMC